MNSNIENSYINTENNFKKIGFLEFFFAIFFIIYSILPAMPTKLSFIYVVILATAYSFFIALTDEKLRQPVIIYLLLILIISIAYFFLTDSSGVSVYVSNFQLKKFMAKYNQFFSLFFPAILCARFIYYGSFFQKKIALIISYISIGFVVLKTLVELAIDPNVAKQFSNIDETTVDNIANYYYVYAIPIVLSIIVMYYFHIERKELKSVLFVTIIILLYFLLKAQYTLAFLIGLAGVYFEFFKKFKNIYVKTLILLLTFISIFFVPFILKIIAENVESDQMALRLNEIYNFIVFGDASGYNLNGRLTLYWKCVEAFFKSPFIGNRTLDFNGHSSILNVPADLGLLGLIPFYYMFFKMNTHIKSLLGDKNYLFTPIFLMFFMMGMTNPIHSSTAIAAVTWLIAPLAINMLFSNENDEINYIEKNS